MDLSVSTQPSDRINEVRNFIDYFRFCAPLDRATYDKVVSSYYKIIEIQGLDSNIDGSQEIRKVQFEALKEIIAFSIGEKLVEELEEFGYPKFTTTEIISDDPYKILLNYREVYGYVYEMFLSNVVKYQIFIKSTMRFLQT